MVSALTPVMRASSPERRFVLVAVTVSVWGLEPVRESSKTYWLWYAAVESTFRKNTEPGAGPVGEEEACYGSMPKAVPQSLCSVHVPPARLVPYSAPNFPTIKDATGWHGPSVLLKKSSSASFHEPFSFSRR